MRNSFITKLKKIRTSYKLIKGVRKNIRRIGTERDLTREQESEIKEYYRNLLGVDVPLDWHRYFIREPGDIPSDIFRPVCITRRLSEELTR